MQLLYLYLLKNGRSCKKIIMKNYHNAFKKIGSCIERLISEDFDKMTDEQKVKITELSEEHKEIK